jgi:ribonuclease HI
MKDKLETLEEMIEEVMTRRESMIVKDYELLLNMYDVITDNKQVEEKNRPDHIIISCDASITKNPGGESAAGVVIEFNNDRNKATEWRREPYQTAQRVPGTTSNQAEYDAIYFGLTTAMDMCNNPRCEIEVRSDSRLVIEQLKGKMKCNDEKLQRKRQIILELVSALPVPVKWTWRPRNSTNAMKQANYLAQDLLGVRRH